MDANELKRWNEQIIAEFRANDGDVGGRFEGAPLLLLHSIGAKSGEPRVNPMMYLRDGDRLVVFASAAGSDRHPAWYHNIKEHPDVTAEVGTQTLTLTAVETTGEERDRLFAEQARRYPAFQGYQDGTDRIIPVIALEPRTAS